jgi:hypothetical protein
MWSTVTAALQQEHAGRTQCFECSVIAAAAAAATAMYAHIIS